MREIIQTDRSLYATVACNPNVDEPLRQWLWTNGGAEVRFDETFGANVITLPAWRSKADEEALYAPCGTAALTKTTATFIPYYAYANRGESDMTVWFRCR